MKGKICIALKYALPVFACIGIVLGMVYYREDGYSHPATRLLYFTTQSNLWIAFISVALLILPRTRFLKKEKVVAALFLLKFIFTVSIAWFFQIYGSWPTIKKHMIDPFYEEKSVNEENKEDADFTDRG